MREQQGPRAVASGTFPDEFCVSLPRWISPGADLLDVQVISDAEPGEGGRAILSIDCENGHPGSGISRANRRR